MSFFSRIATQFAMQIHETLSACTLCIIRYAHFIKVLASICGRGLLTEVSQWKKIANRFLISLMIRRNIELNSYANVCLIIYKIKN